MLAWNDYLPDFKGALTNFFEEKVKPSLDSKTNEFKELVKENFARGANTQKALVVIALAIFLLLTLNLFWVDKENAIQWKYLLLGILVSYSVSHVTALKPWEFKEQLIK